MTDALDPVLQRLDADTDHRLARLADLLAIPSVSTDPAYADHLAHAARWLAEHLRQSRLDAEIIPTDGHGVVLAHTRPEQVADNAQRRVLFYGYYDVQPPQPLELWHTPAFEPTVRDNAIYARGASDDKGQVMGLLEALRAHADAGVKLPCHVTVLIEGEEEIGSVNLPAFIQRHAHRLDADVALVSDTAMWDARTPAIVYALRGLLYFDIQLHGANRDVHSGIYGGAIPNPAIILTRILAGLVDRDARVSLEGYYDHVDRLGDEERQQWADLAFDERAFLDAIGVKRPYGETGYTTLERLWARPSCDINGLYGGYGGEGGKTIVPNHAGAKVSFRLVAQQNPDTIADAFHNWLQSQETWGLTWKIQELGRAWPVAVARDSPYIAAAERALRQAAGRPPVLVRAGATIPVVGTLKHQLQLDSLLVGFGLHSDNLHAPNEHIGLDRFHLGCHTHARLLHEIAAA